MNKTEIQDVQVEERSQEYLTFMISGEIFAVPIQQAKEILEYRDITTVPMAPGFIQGAINLRGSVVPVIDLAKKFGLTISDITRRSCIVIIEVQLDDEATVMGVMVDKVLQVMDIPEQHIDAAPAFGAKIRSEFICGMGKVEGGFTIILDVDRVLSIAEIAVTGNVREEQDNVIATDMQDIAANA